jgi:hypothetical protein
MRRATTLLITVLMGGAILLISSCATVPTEPLGPGEVRLLRMDVPFQGGIRRGAAFTVKIIFEADGKPEIKTACFYFSGFGPYCFKVLEVSYGSPGTIYVDATARDSGQYIVEAYVYYIRDGKTQKSKVISSSITIL